MQQGNYSQQPFMAQGQPAYGQAQPAYGQAQPAYGQPAYGQPGFGQPAPVMQSQMATPVMMAQPVMLVGGRKFYSRTSELVQCPCGYNGPTVVRTDVGNGAWLAAGGLCIVGLFLCAWLPLVMDDCKDAQHCCPQCHSVLGTKKFLLD
jgi:lipopolysaccharide-induced tumor necrosis factor-alpha factor